MSLERALSSEPIALLGAASGVLALTLSLFQEFRHHRADRVELRVSASVRHVYVPSPDRFTDKASPEPPKEPQVLFTITNTGRRRVVLKAFTGNMPGEERHLTTTVLMRGLPRPLDEGEEHHVTISARLFEAEPDLCGFEALDTHGRVWRLLHPDFLKLQSEARAALHVLEEEHAAYLDAVVDRRKQKLGARD